PREEVHRWLDIAGDGRAPGKRSQAQHRPGRVEMTRRDTIVIIGEDLPVLFDLAVGLQQTFPATWTIEAREPLKHVFQPGEEPEVAVAFLTGHENVADIRGVAEKMPRTAFVFLSKTWPPRAAMARAAAACGLILSRNES